MFVYVIVNSETLKIYIGQHKGNNLRKYLQDKFAHAKYYVDRPSRLFASMRKHPRNVWSIHPLLSGLQTREEVNYWERFYIKILNARHPDVGYNICRGGEGFTGPHTEEAKKKLEEVRRRYWSNPENHEKRRELSRRMWADPEKREKIRLAIKNAPSATRFKPGHKPSPNAGAKGPNTTSFQPGIVPWNTGTKGAVKPNSGSFSPGHKLGVGRKFSEEHRRNLSLSHIGKTNASKGKKRSPETRQKLRDAWVRRKTRKQGQ